MRFRNVLFVGYYVTREAERYAEVTIYIQSVFWLLAYYARVAFEKRK